MFGENKKRDTGKSVQVHDHTRGDLSALTVLNALESDPESSSYSNSLQADIAEAEVIVFFANPRGVPSQGGVQGEMENCIAYGSGNPPEDCTLQLYEP